MRGLIACFAFCVAVACGPACASSYDDFSQGEAAVHRGNMDGAIGLFSKALSAGDLAPSYVPNARAGRARAFLAKNQCRNALDDLAAALQLKPDYVEALLLRVDAKICLQKRDDAVADFKAAMKLRPSADSYVVFAITLWRLGEFGLAAENFATAADLFSPSSPYLAKAVLWYAISADRVAKLDQAVLAKHLADIDSEWPAPVLKFYAGKLSEEAVLAKAKSRDQEIATARLCGAHFYLGEWHLARGDVKAARVLLEQAVEQCPRDDDQNHAAQAELQRMPK